MITHDILFRAGQRDARELRAEAQALTGTQIIAREHCVPAFDPGKDYTDWPVGAPVADEGQVWVMIQPHNAAHYQGRPGSLRALWGLAHTTDPARAKAWVDPLGTSGLYMAGECYRGEDGKIYRCKADGTAYHAEALPDGWEEVPL